MDFEQIKTQWESSFKGEEPLNKEQLQTLLSIRDSSNTALDKLVKNHKWGLIISAVMYLILITGICVFIKFPIALVWIAMVSLLMVVVIYYSIRSYNRLKKVEISNEQLKPALEKIIKEVSRNLKFGMGNLYKFVLIPLSLIIGIAIGIYIASGDAGFWQTVQSLQKKSIIKIILIVLIGSVVTIQYSQFIMKRMYKQHVDELKKCLKVFKDEIEIQK